MPSIPAGDFICMHVKAMLEPELVELAKADLEGEHTLKMQQEKVQSMLSRLDKLTGL